jgi:uncharacterized cupin superfamily protein
MKKFETEFGFVISLWEVPEVSISILEIAPGKRIPKHFHKKTREIEIVLSGEVIVNGVCRNKGAVFIWEPGRENAHEYFNASRSFAQVLCVAFPKYDPADSFNV